MLELEELGDCMEGLDCRLEYQRLLAFLQKVPLSVLDGLKV